MPLTRAFGLVLAAGIVLRFATLDGQSLWYDEAVTAHLLQMHLGDMLSTIPDSESSPPAYYVLAWLWAQVAGTGEFGLRALPALLGTATIPVVWALGRRLGGDWAGLFAAALVAVNPMLVWFSQEARVYSLLALLAASSALLWLRALDEDFGLRSPEPHTLGRHDTSQSPTSGRRSTRLLAWGAVSALALATHYYAVFLVAPQALWLVFRVPSLRARATALVLPAAAGVALAPLALDQRSNDSAAFIGESGLAHRLAQVPKQFLVGYDAPSEKLLAVLSAAVLLVAVMGLLRLLASRARRQSDVGALTAVTAAALLVPVALAVAGEDHVVTRNVLFALPLALALAGAGLAAVARVGAIAACAASALLALVAVIGVAANPDYQRDDWRGGARAIGTSTGAERVVVAAPGALVALRYYLPGLRTPAALPAAATEVDYIAVAPRLGGSRSAPQRPGPDFLPGPGFRETGRTQAQTFTVLRTSAPAPAPVDPAALVANIDGRPAQPLVQR